MRELLTALSAAYLTYVVIESQLPPVEWVRERVLTHAGTTIRYLLACWWCTGMWVSAGVVLWSLVFNVELRAPVLLIFADAFVVGVFGEIYQFIHWVRTRFSQRVVS